MVSQFGIVTMENKYFVKELIMEWRLPFSIAVAVISIVTSSSLAHADQLTVNRSSTQLESGNFISSKYLKVLKKTHSPLTAEGGRAINLLVVEKNQDATEVTPIINFHEGVPMFRIDQSGTVTLVNTDGLKIDHYIMQIVNSKEIIVGYGSYPPERFIFVKDLQGVINGKSIAGRYTDRKGRPYKFASNGVATTPTGTLRFAVASDHVLEHFDYFYDLDTHQTYSFVRQKCRLEIYHILDDIEDPFHRKGINKRLFVSLREVNCKAE